MASTWGFLFPLLFFFFYYEFYSWAFFFLFKLGGGGWGGARDEEDEWGLCGWSGLPPLAICLCLPFPIISFFSHKKMLFLLGG